MLRGEGQTHLGSQSSEGGSGSFRGGIAAAEVVSEEESSARIVIAHKRTYG
jgi:hypothetical protein